VPDHSHHSASHKVGTVLITVFSGP